VRPYPVEGYLRYTPPKADKEAVQKICDSLEGAKQPVMIIGNGVYSSRCGPVLQKFAEQNGIAIASSYHGKGTIDETSEIAVGMMGTWGSAAANRMVGVRPNVVYGPGREVGETAAITLAIKAAANGVAFDMPFGGAMCFQYVDEVTDVMLRCLHAMPVGPVVSDLTALPETVDDVIAAIKTCVPDAIIRPSIFRRPAPPAFDKRSLETLIGEWPKVSLSDGVRQTFDYYREQGQ